ncbi:hypothetical protein [Bacillus sp. Marseille-P3661]|uniref:hypothetical protein n=1 Tax=Bacillus sp. Marseille-P3661 TaxID=1936234 RepID=UPI000C82CBA8|nr:hypothetical protein [Bacillus sp. Marseille-P3661]
MIVEEYDVTFVIKSPRKPPELVVVYVCLSEAHYKRNPTQNKEEVIVRNGLFLLSDRCVFHPGVVIKLVKYQQLGLNRIEERIGQNGSAKSESFSH